MRIRGECFSVGIGFLAAAIDPVTNSLFGGATALKLQSKITVQRAANTPRPSSRRSNVLYRSLRDDLAAMHQDPEAVHELYDNPNKIEKKELYLRMLTKWINERLNKPPISNEMAVRFNKFLSDPNNRWHNPFLFGAPRGKHITRVYAGDKVEGRSLFHEFTGVLPPVSRGTRGAIAAASQDSDGEEGTAAEDEQPMVDDETLRKELLDFGKYVDGEELLQNEGTSSVGPNGPGAFRSHPTLHRKAKRMNPYGK